MAGAATAVLVTELIKRILAVVSTQDIWGLIVVPFIGLAISVLVLQGYGHGKALQTLAPEPARPPAPDERGRAGVARCFRATRSRRSSGA